MLTLYLHAYGQCQYAYQPSWSKQIGHPFAGVCEGLKPPRSAASIPKARRADWALLALRSMPARIARQRAWKVMV